MFYRRNIRVMGDDPVCRICGDGEDEEFQLYHPCKCTGSIRYIHEVCLVKWLSIKATGKSLTSDLCYDNGTNCELCGHVFEFEREYSSDASLCRISIILEILKATLMPFFKLVSLFVLCPLLFGLPTVFLTNFFIFENYLEQDNLTTVYIVGVLSCIFSSISNSFLGGRLLSNCFCGVSFNIAFLIISSMVGKHFYEGNDYAHIVPGGFWCSCIFVCGYIVFNLRSYLLEYCLSGIEYLIVPFSVGHFIFEIYLSQILTQRIAVKICLGIVIFVPYIISQKMVFCVSPSNVEREIMNSRILSCLFFNQSLVGSDRRFTRFTTIILRTCSAMIVLLALWPFKWLISHTMTFSIITSQESRDAVTHTNASSHVLPFELFYAHVLVPLLLNVPPIPSGLSAWLESRRSRNCVVTSGYVCRLYCAIVLFTILVPFVCAGGPYIVGKFLLYLFDQFGAFAGVEKSSNLAISYAVGVLTILAIVQIGLRLICCVYSARVTQLIIVSPEAPIGVQTTIPFKGIASLVGLASFGMFFLPLFIGAGFHIVVVSPLKGWVNESRHPHSAGYHWMIPVWIIGIMVMKICFAFASMSSRQNRFRREIDAIMCEYDRLGSLSIQVHKRVWNGIFLPVLKLLGIHVYLPFVLSVGTSQYTVVGYLRISQYMVVGYLLIRIVFMFIIPIAYSKYKSQSEILFNKKYLIKTKLINFSKGHFSNEHFSR